MDGYIEHFIYDNGGEKRDFFGHNIAFCMEKPELYPNAMTMIKLLNSLKSILVPLGVDRRCFSLSRG